LSGNIISPNNIYWSMVRLMVRLCFSRQQERMCWW